MTARAVFLDRDGTLNIHRGFIARPDDIALLPGAGAALQRLHAMGFLTVLVTNQPVIARGETTFEGLKAIHDRLEELLRDDGGRLDAIYFCPHHPERGVAGEVAEFTIDCDCRKPGTGLVLQAARDLDIDLARSWMIGDTTRDVLTANRAGLRAIQVRSGEGAGQDRKYEARPDFVVDDIAAAVDAIAAAEPA
jgi:D,D-heptose 1,7-bisphosphate phosphatase